MTPRVALTILNCLFGIQNVQAQDALRIAGCRFYVDIPATNSPINWRSSHLFLVRRTNESILARVLDSGCGLAEIPFSVKQADTKEAPSHVNFQVGINQPPNGTLHAANAPWSERLNRALSSTQLFLALVTKPSGKTWEDIGPVVPRLLIPVPDNFKVKQRIGKQACMETIFHAISVDSGEGCQLLARWVHREFQSEVGPLLKRIEPVAPADSTLASLSSDSVNQRIGESAISEARNAHSTAKVYLSLIGAIWGNRVRFDSFFDACRSEGSKADPNLLESMVSEPRFAEISIDEALSLLPRIQRKYAGVILKLTRASKEMSALQRKELFLLSASLKPWDRRQIYTMMLSGLPSELMETYPDGFIARGKSDGSTIDEQGYRKKWSEYLGIADVAKP